MWLILQENPTLTISNTDACKQSCGECGRAWKSHEVATAEYGRVTDESGKL